MGIYLDIPKHYIPSYDCLQMAMATIANYMNKDFYMLPLGRWQFYYTPSKSIGNGIAPFFAEK